MKIEYKSINEVIPYEKNARKNDKAVDQVMKSIQEYGFRNPIIIDENNIIIAGHTRHKAGKRMGMTFVPVIQVTDLTEEQKKGYRIADNRTSEFAEWDIDILKMELEGLDKFTGFENVILIDDMKKDSFIEKPEIEFTEILKEEHNYIILYLDNEIDWLQAETFFDIKPVKAYSTRLDGEIKHKMERVGIGRVLNGKKALSRLMEE